MRYPTVSGSEESHLAQVEAIRNPPATAEEYPAPTVTSRDGQPIPELGPVTRVLKTATEHGWLAETQYAEGRYPHATTGRPSTTVKRSVAVKLRRGDRYAVGVIASPVAKADWSWISVWALTPEGMKKLGGITELEAFLKEGP